MSLEARNVHVIRAGRSVLADISLCLRPGELVAVVGPNGAGKSTLLRVLSGTLAPAGGAATLDGRPLQAWPRRDLARRRAVLPQSCTVGLSFTVQEVVCLGRSAHAGRSTRAQDLAAAAAAMAAADVAHLAARSVLELSGGEQQRVHLARALAQIWPGAAEGEARYLLLDEPTASLDIAHQHLVLAAARRLLTRGAGVLAILHDLNLAALYADRVAVMEAGRIVSHGPPEDALQAETISAVFRHRVMTILRPDDGRTAILPSLAGSKAAPAAP